ncbi:hypothetical protein SAMN05216338_104670 [Bradyrhizobium sp. Rc2d]|uniref:hypothetical protein n=1 Tax=Bradyrhizobium sp. Rc2d TaxID=1855321 RepID=UPI0008816942|nr:hypothetical protein [Bradyrhizobium sp. Rc2d]SDJ34223.1 hypothetical protein SAMN05216338_104670 [Bradyrhizobium sp. Rc2d]
MSTTIDQVEGVPASYPTTTPTVSAAVWQRLESYIAYRFTPRAVVWTVEGPGEWHPPLAPAVISKIEIWSDGAWSDITANAPDASPLGGYCLPGCGPYKFTASVGDGMTLPAIVAEAAQRLSAYMAAKPGTPGARSERIEAGSISIQRTRSESWMAAAIQNSGAADLLRNYRRV